jgi:hypothetical protein
MSATLRAMPIPIVFWAAAAAGGTYLAWKNRDAIIEEITKEGGLADTVAEATEPYRQQAKEECDYLMSLPTRKGKEWIEKEVPTMSTVEYGGLHAALAFRTDSNNLKAMELISHMQTVRERANRDKGDGSES